MRDPGSIPRGGYLCETRILLLALSHYNTSLRRGREKEGKFERKKGKEKK
jgi:hypothetical protein